MMVEAMKQNDNGGVSQGVLENVKKTKNTSIKNLRVDVEGADGNSVSHSIKNMCQVWKFCKEHYSNESCMKDFIKVYHDGKMLHDLHAEKKLSGKVWMVDKMQIGKHTKKKS